MRTRLLGIRLVPIGVGLVLAGGSVHGFGLRAPLEVVGVDRAGVVVGRTVLRRNGLVSMPDARIVIEVPAGTASLSSIRAGDVLRCGVGRVPG